MPPTRKEQLQLDELLSDIYRGIEALPDKSAYGTTNIYHGTYQLNSSSGNNNGNSNKSSPSGGNLVARTYVQEYELPASSPQVRQHLANLRQQPGDQAAAALEASAATPSAESSRASAQQHQHQHQQHYYSPHKQPQRSTLKRSTTNNTPDLYGQQQAQSLASFMNSSATPENKRRVRIVDHPEKFSSKSGNQQQQQQYGGGGGGKYNHHNHEDDDDADYAAEEVGEQQQQQQPQRPTKVKYFNTNKLIYHQEKNPEDYDDENSSDENNYRNNRKGNNDEADDDDDIDGVTRVEYYHTTWLDRQLGRASKRRSSKELNERQVKEKAMIEELKRSLKNGAITLRQSLRGNKDKQRTKQSSDNKANNSSESFDDFGLERHHSLRHQNSSSSSKPKSTNAIGSGLATLPRNHHRVQYPATPVSYETWANRSKESPKSAPSRSGSNYYSPAPSSVLDQPVAAATAPQYSYSLRATPKQTSNNFANTSSTLNRMQPQTTSDRSTTAGSDFYSRTLPHKAKSGEHSLIESHLRGSRINNNNNNHSAAVNSSQQRELGSSTLPYAASRDINRETPIGGLSNMRQPIYQQGRYASSPTGIRSPTCTNMDQQQQQQQQQPPPRQTTGNTISSMPSATEVVRSALSRSSSQVSLNQLNKTINLLPNSPPPYSPSPAQTPTGQLRAASPGSSISASPAKCSSFNHQHQHQHSSATPDRMQQQHQQQSRLYGTRTLERNQQMQQPAAAAAAQQNRQPTTIYANPHASLMQHKAEQQMRQPTRNAASIREFNELDNLLRSLSPASAHTTAHITPGYSSKPAQPSFGGYSFTPAAAAAAKPQHYQAPNNNNSGSELYARVQKPASTIYQTPTDQTKASYLQQNYALASQQQTHQPYTIDVSNKKPDDCFKRQELSEFEAPIELIPSMEDYQNITKLNPVKNHYWYKPNMSRDRAISLLKDKPQGTFIVRDSTSFRGAYGLALKVAKLPKNVLNNANLRNYNDPSVELIRHFLIEPTPSGVRLKGYENEPIFNSLPDLIYQHSLTELALPCRLIIPRADIEDPNFNLKQKQFFDDFVASKEQAKHLPYERTSPDGGYRKYPGNVYVHNEHRIIFE